MGTKVQCESYRPGYLQMKDISDDANSCSWPVYYGDKAFTNGQYYNGFVPRAVTETYPGYDKDLVKRTMLEHEATFRHQLYELHRLYRIQRDLMDEVKRKELYKIRKQVEASQVTSEETRKWHIENVTSPLSSVKGSSNYVSSPFPYRNGSASKDVEILESRPTKARRKMFDLRLPAEEYIDTEEGDRNVSGKVQIRNLNNSGKNGFKANCGDVVDSSSRGKTSVADLNEPIVIEEESNPSEHLNPNRGSATGPWARQGFQRNENGKHWLKPTCEDGLPGLFNRALDPPSFSVIDQKKNYLRDRTGPGLDRVERSIDSSSSCHREAVIASNVSNSYPLAPDSNKSWSHSALSWEKPNGILSQNSALHQTWSKSSQSSTQSNGKFGDRWNCNTVSTSNQKFGSEMVSRSGYRNGISAGLNELQFSVPSGSYGQLNRSAVGNAAPENLINHGSVKFSYGSSYLDSRHVKGVNSNVAVSNGSTNKVANQHCIEVIDLERKDDSNLSSLPWLRSTSEATSTKIDLNADDTSFVGSFQSFSDKDGKMPASQAPACRKVLGFPLFHGAHVPKKEASEAEVEKKVKNILFDMNMPCDELLEDEKADKVSNFRCEIDLNSCVSEDEEASLLPCVSDSNKKRVTGIDLEAPFVPEAEEVSGESLDELTKVAAEAIVAISSSTAPRNPDEDAGCSLNPLHWFAEVISSCGDDDIETRSKSVSKSPSSSSKPFDYFEFMTLKLTETKEEDYMPKPLVPEGLILDQTGTSTAVPTRPRRGNARRGRQKRDFQRDILPGLISLSRHEVTEDIQTFGGLMRATGHPTWQSGLARRGSGRNGVGRGRKRTVVSSPPRLVDVSPPPPLIQQLNTIEVGIEDTSLRGWGKTTRRPRRQRCPPGNLPTLPVT